MRRASLERTEVEVLYYRAVFQACPELRPSAEELYEDLACASRAVGKDHGPEIAPGQLWRRLDELILVVGLKTNAGGHFCGHGGHFIVLVEDPEEPGHPFEINAARIRMYWHLEREAVNEGQLELFA